MGAAESLLVAGIVCIVAAVVGGGVKMLGAEMPVLSSFGRQALLFAVGLAFLFASFVVLQPKPAPQTSGNLAVSQMHLATASPAQSAAPTPSKSPTPSPSPAVSQPAPASPAPASPGCAGSPLDCLPRSSGPVTFRDPAAASAAAAQNLRDNLSTTEAATIAARQGADSRAARSCGIVASNDSSPLGKHLAAERLTALASVTPSEVNPACLQMAQAFL
jgi:hypothetical protein